MLNGAVTVFILTTGGWFSPMLDGISVVGSEAAVFYVVIVLIGTYLMMNLLVAVLFFHADEAVGWELSETRWRLGCAAWRRLGRSRNVVPPAGVPMPALKITKPVPSSKCFVAG